MEKIVMHVTDSQSGHKDVKVINLAHHPSSGASSQDVQLSWCHISKMGNFLDLQARSFELLTSKHDINP
jgi:hypothetical protein